MCYMFDKCHKAQCEVQFSLATALVKVGRGVSAYVSGKCLYHPSNHHHAVITRMKFGRKPASTGSPRLHGLALPEAENRASLCWLCARAHPGHLGLSFEFNPGLREFSSMKKCQRMLVHALVSFFGTARGPNKIEVDQRPKAHTKPRCDRIKPHLLPLTTSWLAGCCVRAPPFIMEKVHFKP
jgi:hypothetical protein